MTGIFSRSMHWTHGCHARVHVLSARPGNPLVSYVFVAKCINDGFSYTELDMQESSHAERQSFGEIS